jgi:hypothetical protein
VTASATHFKGFFDSRYLQATILFIPVLEVIRNPTGGRLVPLEWENVMVISNLDLIALFPAPSPISPHYVINDLFRRVLCIY